VLAGVYEMANLFSKTDSLLIHKIIKEKSWLPDPTGTVTIER
jgi:hypothetical protein